MCLESNYSHLPSITTPTICARDPREYIIPETKKYEKMKFLLPCSAHSVANMRPRDVRYV